MYRYLEIMNFGYGDKRTSVMSALHEIPEKRIGNIISNYKVILKLTEKEYEAIHKLLEYKGEYSYNELRAKVNNLSEKIDKAKDYIKNNIDNTGWLEIGSKNVKELLEILGDKENE
ncbi:MAG: hypothetical protein IIZ67_05415 [Bacilli bacterium]|nr:hypothetical protein [Bacilli bacterium]